MKLILIGSTHLFSSYLLHSPFCAGGCGDDCQIIAGQMTIRSTTDGDLPHNELYCAALEVIFYQIQSGALAGDIEGIAATQYIVDPRGTDRTCDLRTRAGPQPIPVTFDGGSERSGISSTGVVAGVSIATGVFVVVVGILLARKRFMRDPDSNVSVSSVSPGQSID